MVDPVLVGIGEGRVEGVVVHADRRLGVPGEPHGVIEFDHVGGALAGLVLGLPVIAVGAVGHDRLFRVELGHAQVQVLLVPVLAGGRPGISGAPVLVIGHQHQGVGRLLHGLERKILVIERRGDPDFQAVGSQHIAGVLQKGRVGGYGVRRQVLQVEAVAGVATLGRLLDQGR